MKTLKYTENSCEHPAHDGAVGLTHLPVAVVGGVGSKNTADLHVGKLLLKNFNHISDAQPSADCHPVKYLVRESCF